MADNKHKLEIELSEALTDDAIEQILIICDKLHEAIPVEGYTIDDIPSDEIYEQYCLRVGHKNMFSDVVKGPIMFMGSVYKPKNDEDIVVDDIVLSPKYDGTSLAIRFVRNGDVFEPVEAHTKGRDVGTEHVNQDVTDKIKYFINNVTVKNTEIAKKTFKDVIEFHVRGEFICRNKIYDENGNPAASHSGIASGQINRLLSEFKKGLENFDFVGYEVAKVFRKIDVAGSGCSGSVSCGKKSSEKGLSDKLNSRTNAKTSSEKGLSDKPINKTKPEKDLSDKLNSKTEPEKELSEIIPTQKFVFKILKMLEINYRCNPPEDIYSGSSWIASSSVDVDFPETYKQILEVERHPTDGVVYCSKDWKYPTEESKFKSKFYGKYAWKPQSSKHVVAKEIEYSMAKDGEINFAIIYDSTQVNGKNYTKAKAGTNKLQNLIEKGLGKGAICKLELKNDVIPYIGEVISRAQTIFELPVKCPFCGENLTYESDKDNELRHIRCENANCSVLSITKWAKFISAMNKIYKQANGEILKTLNDDGNVVKSAISEKKLEKLAETKTLNKETIEEYMPTLFAEFEALDLETQLTVLGLGGKLAVKKMIRENGYQTLDDVPNVWIYN